jgi:cytosine/adenosine deaminase-related metal-dependent hydrolase
VDCYTKPSNDLQECVSSRAKAAIGLKAASLNIKVGDPADFVLFGKEDTEWRTRRSITQVVYDAGDGRMTIYNGRLIYVDSERVKLLKQVSSTSHP